METDNREIVERFCERLADRLDFAPSYLTEKVEYALRWSETALAEASQLSGVVGERCIPRDLIMRVREETAHETGITSTTCADVSDVEQEDDGTYTVVVRVMSSALVAALNKTGGQS